MFDADRAIISSNQDRLNRTQFAQYLARSILDRTDTDSFVIGVYGGWASGKTSIINLIIEELKTAGTSLLEDQKPIILNFSCWSYSGQSELTYNFFRRLSSVVRSAENLENANKIIYLLELYVSYFTQKPIPKTLKKITDWKERLRGYKKESFAAGWESGRDLTEVKAELNELLKQQKHKIIIFIDNLSRLRSEEIREIFQIIKSIGDYTNTTYVLACDPDQIISAMNYKVENGDAFLAKIVQLPFRIPPIELQDLEIILADRLEVLVDNIPTDRWDKEAWADYYYGIIKQLMLNVRDVTRYVNMLNFSYPRVKEVVNAVDYFALTALEIFLPEIYAGIRDNRDLFTDLLEQVYTLDADRITKERARIDEICARSKFVAKEDLLEFLIRLFPRLHLIYHPELSHFHHIENARKNRCICSSDVFDVYFRLSIQSGQMTESEFATLLSFSNDAETFAAALARLNQDNTVIKFLDQFNHRIIKKVPHTAISIIIKALMDDADLFPEGNTGKLSLTTPVKIHRLVQALLKKITAQEERFLILKESILGANKSIYSIVHEIIMQQPEHDENLFSSLPIEQRLFSAENLNELKQLTANRISFWCETGRLPQHPKIIELLVAWKNWGDIDEVQQKVLNFLTEPKYVLAILTSAFSDSIQRAMTAYQKPNALPQKLIVLEDVMPLTTLVDHAKLIFEAQSFETLKEEEQLAILIFLDLMNVPTEKFFPKTTA